MTDSRLSAAVSLFGSESEHRLLLQSIVDVTRATFDAKATSITRHDEHAQALVFEAVSGEGETTLVGQHLPSTTGVAGWVLATGQMLILDDVRSDPRFATTAAEATGYVPKAITSCPLIAREQPLGVMQILDRGSHQPWTPRDLDLLGKLAHHAAIGLDLFERARGARALLTNADDSVLGRLATTLDHAEPEDQKLWLELLQNLETLLNQAQP